LGDHFDIYASSRELLFPHHENVNAIAAAVTGKPLARYWIHCDRILIDGKKVDEDDCRYDLDDLARMGYSGRLIRYWLFSNHYRKPISFSEERLKQAKQSLKRIDQCVAMLKNIKDGQPYAELDQLLYDIKNGFTSAMDDDLNIAKAMSAVFENIKRINKLALEKKIDPPGAAQILTTLRSIDAVLGFLEADTTMVDAEIQRLMAAREKARSEKNWMLADQIRDRLKSLGLTVRDQKT
jgi:cysteinyl-tRNA synthetase